MTSFKKIAPVTGNYAAQVQDAQRVYDCELSDDNYMIGERLSEQNIHFDAKAWVAWIRKATVTEEENRVVICVPQKAAMFWLEFIRKHFHNDLARYFNKEIYYADHEKVHNLANYGTIDYASLSPAEQKYYDDGFAEAKQNIRDFIKKGNPMRYGG